MPKERSDTVFQGRMDPRTVPSDRKLGKLGRLRSPGDLIPKLIRADGKRQATPNVRDRPYCTKGQYRSSSPGERMGWGSFIVEQIAKGNIMSLRAVISVALVSTLGLACVSTDALAYRGGVYRGGGVAVRGGVYRGGAVAWRGGAYRGAGLAVGAAAVGAAVAAPYYNRPACGYYPYPPCY
jgi:hypothetical protein